MLGLIIGLAAGAVHFYVLSRFTASITGGVFSPRLAILGVLQFLIPLLVLLICALTIRHLLLWVGVGMAAALIGGAIIKFVMSSQRAKGRDKKDG